MSFDIFSLLVKRGSICFVTNTTYKKTLKQLIAFALVITLFYSTSINILATTFAPTTGGAWTGVAGGLATSKTFPSGVVASIGLIPANTGSFTVSNTNTNLGVRSATAAHFTPTPNTPATTSSVDITSNVNVAGQPATCLDGTALNGTSCPIGVMNVSFSRPVRNPVMHIVGIGGSSTKTNVFGIATTSASFTEFTLNSPGITYGVKSAGSSNLSVTSTVLKANNGAVGTLTTTCTAAGSTTGAGCGSVPIVSSVTNNLVSSFSLNTKLNTANTGPGNTTGPDAYAISFSFDDDFGDAPVSYDGTTPAYHTLSDLQIGTAVTAENFQNYGTLTSHANQTATATADTDDAGLVLPSILTNQTGTYSQTIPLSGVSGPATLCGWIDLNKNGTFEVAEKQCATVASGATSATLAWTLAGTQVAGQSYARFRLGYNSTQINNPNGPADSGEVEDYPITIVQYVPNADLKLTKIVSNTTPSLGDIVTYTLKVDNLGPDSATTPKITDILPAGLSFISATPAATTTVGTTRTWNLATMVNGGSSTVTYTATVTGSVAQTNNANVSSTTPDLVTSNNASTATVTPVVPNADLAVTKSVTPVNAPVGTFVDYVITVKNNGPDTALNVKAVDTLPVGVLYNTATPAPTTTTPLAWNLGSITNGVTKTIALKGYVSAVGPQLNTVTATTDSTDSNTANNTALANNNGPVIADSDVSITKSVTPTNATPGQTVTYTVNVTNNGTGTAPDTVVADQIPTGMTYVSGSPAATTTPPNYITNGDFEQGNVGFSYDYNYIPVSASACQSDAYTGSVSVMTTADCLIHARNVYWSTESDHTTLGTVPGNYLFVNAGTNANPANQTAWSQTVTGLIPSKQYKFCYYAHDAVMNWNVGVTFPAAKTNIDGITTQTITPFPYLTNNSDANWVQYCSTYTADADGASKLEIINTNVNPAYANLHANDFVIDDISLVPLDNTGIKYYNTGALAPGQTKTITYTAIYNGTGAQTNKASVKSTSDTNPEGVNNYAQATVTGPLNQQPVAVNDPYTTPVNTPKTLTPLTSDTDPDAGQTLTVTAINGVTLTPGTAQTISVPNGTVTVSSTGVIVFTPTPNFTGTATFPYTISDGNGGTATANEIITIIKAVDDTKTTPVGTPVTYNPLTNDSVPSGSTISKINGVTPIVGTPIPVPGGTVTLNADGTVTVSPTPGSDAPITFPYEVTTPDGTKVTATDTITVVKATNDTKTTPVSTPVTYDPKTNDTVPSGSTITKINGVTPVVGTPISVPGGTVTLNSDGAITVTPTTGSTTSIVFPYEVTTPTGDKVTAQDTVNIVKAVDDIKSTPLNTPVTYDPKANDQVPPGSTITKINGVTPVVGTPITVPGGTVTLNSDGTVTATPTTASTLPITFPYEVTTVDGTKTTANDIITPVKVLDDTKTTPVNTPITYDPKANDSVPSGSVISLINNVVPVVGTPILVTGGTVTLNADGTVTVTPTPGSTTQIVFPYEVTTLDGLKTIATDTITIIKAVNDGKTTPVGAPITYNPLSNDVVPPGSTITKINGVTPVVGAPIPVTGGTVTLNADGTITVTPTPGSTTPITFPYEVTTPDGTTTTANDTITPVKAVDDIKTTPVGTPITYDPKANDSVPPGSTITQINGVTPVVGTPITVPGGTVTLNSDGTIKVSPAPGSTTPVTFPYTVTTPDGTAVIANDTITPVKAVDDAKTTKVNTPITYDPKTNDSIPLGSTISKINGVTPVVGTPISIPNGTVTLNVDGTVTVTPNPGYTGTLTFPYEVTTPDGTKVTATDTITIIKVTDDTATTPASTPVTYAPLANDTVPVGSTISQINNQVPVVGTPITIPNGTVTLNTDGTVTVTPDPGFTGTLTFPYEVTTPDGTKATATDTITVTNNPPVAITDNYTTTIGVPVTLTPLTADTDPDVGQTLSVTSINGTTLTPGTAQTISTPHGTVTVSAAAVIVYTPAPGFVGTETIPYIISDGRGGTATANEVITIPQSASLELDKKSTYNDTNGNGAGDVGETITYQFIVKNTGNVPLTTVTISDPSVTVIGGPIATLAVGATDSTTFTATHTVVAADITAGSFTNTATASGTPPTGPAVTDVSNDPRTTGANDPTITPIPPFVFPDNKTTPVNTSVTYFPLVNDILPAASTITQINGVTPVVGTPIPVPNGTVTLNTDNSFTFAPTTGFTGTSVFPYTVTTPGGPLTTTDTITIIKAVDDVKTTPLDTPITYNPLTNDSVLPGSTITKINGATVVIGTPITVPGGTITVNSDGTITVTPNPGSTTSISFLYDVTTPDGTSTTATDTITIIKAVNDTDSTPINTPITYNPLANDLVPPGSTITKISGVTPVVGTPIIIPGGTVVLNADSTITVTPNTGFGGTLTFPYEVTTQDGTKTTAVDIITIIKANDDSVTTTAATPVTLNPLTNDNVPPGSAITQINGVTPVVGTSIPVPNGTATLNSDGTITFTPNLGYVGPVIFPYEVTTPAGKKLVAKVEATVSGTAKVVIDKKVYKNHDLGASCSTGVDELVIVEKVQSLKPVTWCFTVTNTGDTYLNNITIADPTLSITQAQMTLVLGSTLLAPGASQLYFYEMQTDTSIDNDAFVTAKVVDSTGVTLGLPDTTANDPSGAKIIYVFDPPFGVKTGTYLGNDIVRWTMVWINDSSAIASGVTITDEPPLGTTYNGNLVCTPRGLTTVTSCTYNSPSVGFPRGQIVVTGTIHPNPGVSDLSPLISTNALEIAFDNLVPSTAGEVSNQGVLTWNPNNDPDGGFNVRTRSPNGVVEPTTFNVKQARLAETGRNISVLLIGSGVIILITLATLQYRKKYLKQ
jgi:Domain of unknown function DUF11/Bacterial Ig domain/GEVED domain